MLSGDASLRSYDNTVLTFGGTAGQTYVGGSCADDSCTGGSFQPGSVSGGQTFTGRPVADRISFNCLDYSGGHPETPYLSQTAYCPDGLRAQIQFQSCWDGVNLYKTDNSHVAYMSQIENGICPPTHPFQFVHLFFEILYGVNDIKQDGGRYVFAQGDTTGYGFHGDFLNGWDMGVQTAALKNCANTDNAGQISACPELMASDVQNFNEICPEQPAIVNEPVKGMLSKLPGCITVTSGPNSATSADMICGPNIVPPTINPPAKAQVPVTPAVGSVENGWAYAGCASESTSGRALSAASFASDSMTNQACQSFCASKGQPIAGTGKK